MSPGGLIGESDNTGKNRLLNHKGKHYNLTYMVVIEKSNQSNTILTSYAARSLITLTLKSFSSVLLFFKSVLKF